MASPSELPALIRVQLTAKPGLESLHGLSLKQGEEGAIVVYHIGVEGPASSTDLRDGCEILSINGHRVASTGKAVNMLAHYMEKTGAVDIVASKGERPRGSKYVLAKNIGDKSIFVDKEANIVDGLLLEDKRGYIQVLKTPATGFFSTTRLNKGDLIWSIDGNPVRDIGDFRQALIKSAGAVIYILTYNCFRKLKTTVMANTAYELKGDGKAQIGSVGKPTRIEDTYNIHQKLGEGAFAVVKKASHKVTGDVYAIKIVKRSSLDKDTEDALKQEIYILNELEHDHIMNLHSVVVTLDKYYLVTEFLEGGELFDRIVNKSSYTESEARDVCKVLFSALKYIQSNRIAHRDLKPENLLLQYKHSDTEIKIADFGFAKRASSEDSLETLCGTPGYVSPEVLSMKKYGTQCDMWAMGVIVFILLGGYPPFIADNEKELFRLTKRGEFKFDQDHWSEISRGAKELISSLLVTNPRKRATAEDVLSHPWMNEDGARLKRQSLAVTQGALKRHIARNRLKKAIHSVVWVTGYSGSHGIFSEKNRAKLYVINDAVEMTIEE